MLSVLPFAAAQHHYHCTYTGVLFLRKTEAKKSQEFQLDDLLSLRDYNRVNLKMSKREHGLCFKKYCSLTSWLLYCCCFFINIVNGYSIKNCTVRGSLKYSQNINVFCDKRSLCFVPGNIPDKTTYLDISDNVIQKIIKEYFSQLDNLRSLNVRHNKIKDVEEGAFSSLGALQELNLANNRLTDILGGMFQNLGNLTVLLN